MKSHAHVLDRIKTILKEQQKSHQSLAEEIGIAKSTLSQILSGKSKMNTDRLKVIAKALNIEVKELKVTTDESLPIKDSYLPATEQLVASTDNSLAKTENSTTLIHSKKRPLTYKIRGTLTTRHSKRSFDALLFAIEDYITMKEVN